MTYIQISQSDLYVDRLFAKIVKLLNLLIFGLKNNTFLRNHFSYEYVIILVNLERNLNHKLNNSEKKIWVSN